MPATKNTDTMKINAVYGPNDHGFYDILVTGPRGEMKLGTKIPKLAQAAKGAQGEYANVEWSAKQGNKKTDGSGEYWMNYRLEGIQGENGDLLPPPAEEKDISKTSSKDESIARQVGLKCAVWALGPMQDDVTDEAYFQAAVLLAERFAGYALRGPLSVDFTPETDHQPDPDGYGDVPF